MKKARTAVLPTDVPECPAAVSGCQQKPGSPRAPASKGKSCNLWVATYSVVLLEGTGAPEPSLLGVEYPFDLI